MLPLGFPPLLKSNLTIMKKHLLFALAAFGMVACMQDEVVTVQQDAISFKGAFVEKATRAAFDPSTTENTIADFNVWGFMDEVAGEVFNGDKVTRVGNAWTYDNTQYWAPKHTYYFAAVSPADSRNWSLDTSDANEYGPGVISFTNIDGSEDLLYTATSVETPAYDDLKADGMEAVDLTFNHLLSKVKFTFTNGFATPNTSIEIADVQMTVPEKGTIDLAVENWWDNNGWQPEGTLSLAFGGAGKLAAGQTSECGRACLTIPVSNEHEYTVTFVVVLYIGEREALTTVKSATFTGVALKMGKSYNFKAEINPENLELPAIEFDVVEVKDWDEAGDQYLPDHVPAVKVATAADFEAALAAKCPNITLVNDIELTSDITKVVGDLVLDLNGFNITSDRSVVDGYSAAQISTLYIEGVKLTVVGTGKILNVGDKGGYAVTVAEDGTGVIKGNVTVGSYYDALYVRKGALYIENGFHYATEYSAPKIDSFGCHASTVINCYDNDKSDVYVTGGTFVNMDPSNVHEWKQHNKSFVVDGYTVVSEDKGNGEIWYTVVPA